ncbi:MAG: hypothetical protein ACOCZ5_01710 [bacterium]
MAFGFICYVRHYCKELLGNIHDSDIGNTTMMGEGLSLIRGMNDDGAPLSGSYKQDKYPEFLRKLENHIKDHVGKELSGHVDTLDLFEDEDLGLYNIFRKH